MLRFVGNLWIRARMVRHWQLRKIEAKKKFETRTRIVANHTASQGPRKTLNVIVVANLDMLRNIISSGSICRKRKKERG